MYFLLFTFVAPQNDGFMHFPSNEAAVDIDSFVHHKTVYSRIGKEDTL
jgi:hypothetical protein